MAHKEIKYNSEARSALEAGVDAVANAVKVTLGPKGRYVVLAPFLTLCQEECPLTTGVYQELQASVDKAGLGHKVAFVEVNVDPERDTPARLRAYEQRFGPLVVEVARSLSHSGSGAMRLAV